MKTPPATPNRGNRTPVNGLLSYRRTPIEIESPEQYGYKTIQYNLAESAVTDMCYPDLGADLDSITLSYTDHRGNPQLRQYIGDKEMDEEAVLVTAGASAALFIVATSLLTRGAHAVILHPNYVTNIETPRAMGCCVDYLNLTFKTQFRIDLEKLEHAINPDTRFVSLTYPHNPTGVTITESELKEIISLIEAKGCYLLMDETYREMAHPVLPSAASLSPNAISVSSLSKSYGLPGIRIGWLMTQDAQLMERFLAAKEQIFICNSVVDEKIAEYVLANKEKFLPKIKAHILSNFKIIKSWMDSNEYCEWVRPTGGCVCFPRVSPHSDMAKVYRRLREYKTVVGPGHWFEMDDQYMRIGYGYPSSEELQGGLSCITKALKEVIR